MEDEEWLNATDIAERLGITPESLRKYRTDSRPGHRYADHPFPAHDRIDPHGRGGRQAQWHRDRLPLIDAWARNRGGRGAGGGRPWPEPPSMTVRDEGPFVVRSVTGYGHVHDGHRTVRTVGGAPVPVCGPARANALHGRMSYERLPDGAVTCWRCLAIEEHDAGGSGG